MCSIVNVALFLSITCSVSAYRNSVILHPSAYGLFGCKAISCLLYAPGYFTAYVSTFVFGFTADWKLNPYKIKHTCILRYCRLQI